MVTADRRSLAELLSRWQAGEMSAWQMIEEAEEAENLLFGEATEVPEIPKSDPQSIPVAVLEMLSAAHHQRVLPSDIPALLEFLQAEPGRELVGSIRPILGSRGCGRQEGNWRRSSISRQRGSKSESAV